MVRQPVIKYSIQSEGREEEKKSSKFIMDHRRGQGYKRNNRLLHTVFVYSFIAIHSKIVLVVFFLSRKEKKMGDRVFESKKNIVYKFENRLVFEIYYLLFNKYLDIEYIRKRCLLN